MQFQTILCEVDDGLLTITLNRPERLNAFNRQMRLDICAALDRADADDAVRAVIFTGAGRGFCAGADLSGGAATFDREARGVAPRVQADGRVDYADDSMRDGGGRVTLRIFECLKATLIRR